MARTGRADKAHPAFPAEFELRDPPMLW